jgi:hypothetical protein
MRVLGPVTLLFLLSAGGVAAQPAGAPAAPAAARAPAGGATPKVSEFVVPGGPQPKVAATFPADGATIAAGDLVIKVQFDQPMIAGRWSFGPAPGGAFPVCLSTPRLLADKRTFVLLCQVKAGAAYAVTLGGPPGFGAQGGRDMAPQVLKFSAGQDIVDDLHDALDEAGLADADEPIMTWTDDGATPPRSQPKTPPAGGG